MIKAKDQTIVEWLRQEYKNPNRNIFMDDLFIKALAMEKQQMKEMYLKGIENYDPTFKNKAYDN